MPVPVCARYNSVYPHWRQEMVTNFLFCTLNSLAKSPPVAWNWSLSYDRHPHLTQTY